MVVAALPGIIFGGINIITLLKFSFNLGKYQGEQDAKGVALGVDLKDIKSDIAEIRAEVKTCNANFQDTRLEMQANTILLKYLQARDEEIGRRTHKIANLEHIVNGLAGELTAMRRELDRPR